MKTGIIVLAFAFATACTSNPSGGGAAARTAQVDDPEKGIICTYEKPTGSFLREKKCTTPEQREAEAQQRATLMDVRNERDSGL